MFTSWADTDSAIKRVAAIVKMGERENGKTKERVFHSNSFTWFMSSLVHYIRFQVGNGKNHLTDRKAAFFIRFLATVL